MRYFLLIVAAAASLGLTQANSSASKASDCCNGSACCRAHKACCNLAH